jgi:predicted nucleic acid-binding Zn ribbon protein
VRDAEHDPERAPEGPQPASLGELLARVRGRRDWARRLEGARVHERWREIAGDELARHVQPVRLLGGVLVVRAASPAWATQVRYLSGELLTRANAVLGDGSVRQITVTAQTGP